MKGMKLQDISGSELLLHAPAVVELLKFPLGEVPVLFSARCR